MAIVAVVPMQQRLARKRRAALQHRLSADALLAGGHTRRIGRNLPVNADRSCNSAPALAQNSPSGDRTADA
jgi:hypothetical protein